MLDGPIVRQDSCVLEFGEVFLAVNPKVGGRVTSARLAGRECLLDSRLHPANYGSTFWTSPQSEWGWPPVQEIDSAEFALEHDARSFTLRGPAVVSCDAPNVAGIVLSKRYSADFEQRAIVIDYTLSNPTGSSKRLAPWEITRVPAGGLTFYASDAAPVTPSPVPEGAMPKQFMRTTRGAGCVWFQHDVDTPEHAKLNGEGKGWLAHLTSERVLLIKSFPAAPVTACAPYEADVEIYASGPAGLAGSYVEVENQGAYALIPPRGSLTWSVRWYLRALPASISASPGNPELVSFVTSAIY